MPLFLIEHQHTTETCPTRDPNMVRMLRQHVSDENAAKMGVKILGDWASEPEHQVVFIVEAADAQTVENLAGPFRQVGDVNVRMGLTCDDTAKACLGE
jgi:uncharacterized protein with GYD domain